MTRVEEEDRDDHPIYFDTEPEVRRRRHTPRCLPRLASNSKRSRNKLAGTTSELPAPKTSKESTRVSPRSCTRSTSLAYPAKDARNDGLWRKIAIRVNRTGVKAEPGAATTPGDLTAASAFLAHPLLRGCVTPGTPPTSDQRAPLFGLRRPLLVRLSVECVAALLSWRVAVHNTRRKSAATHSRIKKPREGGAVQIRAHAKSWGDSGDCSHSLFGWRYFPRFHTISDEVALRRQPDAQPGGNFSAAGLMCKLGIYVI